MIRQPRPDLVGIAPRAPLTPLDDERGVGNLCVAARVVEVEVGVDEEANLSHVYAQARDPCGDLLSRMELHLEDLRERTETSGRIPLRIGVETAVEEHLPFGVVDEVARDGYPDATAFALQKST